MDNLEISQTSEIDDDNNELQLAENLNIPEEDYKDSTPSFEEKRELLKKTKILKQTWSILETFQKIRGHKLILSPVYQRNAIWSAEKQSSFIESIFMDILIPPIYVVEIPGNNMLEDSSYEVVDGKQRLTAIENFIKGDLKLRRKALEYFSDLYGDKVFNQINEEYETEIKALLSSVLDIYVITANSPEFTKYDIFSRLNKGAEKLKVNEIRKAIYRSETLEKIEKFVDKYLENPEEKLKYSKVFSVTDIKRYEDFGRFYKSIAFYIRSKSDDGEEWKVENYNSRPRDMINSCLNSIQKKEVIITEEELLLILNTTLNLSIWLEEKGVPSNQIEYIIDSVVPFINKIKDNYDIIEPIIKNAEYLSTFEKSPSTTSNVNLRLSIAAGFLLQ